MTSRAGASGVGRPSRGLVLRGPRRVQRRRFGVVLHLQRVDHLDGDLALPGGRLGADRQLLHHAAGTRGGFGSPSALCLHLAELLSQFGMCRLDLGLDFRYGRAGDFGLTPQEVICHGDDNRAEHEQVHDFGLHNVV